MCSSDLDDFTVANGSTPTITCTASACTATTTALSEGDVTITVSPDFAVRDIAGNETTSAAILADTSVTYDRQVTFDSIAPVVTVQQAADQVDPARNATIRFALTASEPLAGASVTAADVTVTNATGVTVSGSGAAYEITATATGQGAVTIAPSGTFSVSDPAGNDTTTAGGTDRTVTYDSVAPVATLTQGADQVDPTNGADLVFTFTTNESVVADSVTADDFAVSGGAITAVTGSGSTYAIAVTAAGDGTVAIAPSLTFAVEDPAGNATTSAGGADRSVVYDSTSAVVSLEQAAGQADPAKNAAIAFTFSSSEDLRSASVTTADFDATNGTIASVTGSGDTYTVTVTATTDGDVSIAPSGAFSVADPGGNTTTVAGGTDRTVEIGRAHV